MPCCTWAGYGRRQMPCGRLSWRSGGGRLSPMVVYRLWAMGAALVTVAAAMPTPATAADIKWVAAKSLANGVPARCGEAPWSNFTLVLRGNILTGTPTGSPNHKDFPIRVDFKSLEPDGSGSVIFMPPNGIGPAQYRIESGSGPRRIIHGRMNSECRYQLQPK
jgi:hypothetical protein